MSKAQDRIISRRADGLWADKRLDASKAAGVYATQRKAVDAGRERLKNQGGGELIVQNRQGKIARKDTIAPGKDRFPPRG
jgi:hypothetical protein